MKYNLVLEIYEININLKLNLFVYIYYTKEKSIRRVHVLHVELNS
jgi:hypothetical protein